MEWKQEWTGVVFGLLPPAAQKFLKNDFARRKKVQWYHKINDGTGGWEDTGEPVWSVDCAYRPCSLKYRAEVRDVYKLPNGTCVVAGCSAAVGSGNVNDLTIAAFCLTKEEAEEFAAEFRKLGYLHELSSLWHYHPVVNGVLQPHAVCVGLVEKE